MRIARRILWTALPVVLALAGAAIFLALSKPASARQSGATDPADLAAQPRPEKPLAGLQSDSDPITPTVQLYIPRLFGGGTPGVEIVDHGFSEQLGIDKFAFLPRTPFIIHTLLHNHYAITITVGLQISQTSLCGNTQIFSNTVTLPPGLTLHTVPSLAMDCSAVYTSTALLTHLHENPSRHEKYVVNPPGVIVLSGAHAFDRCTPPSLSSMQVWWDRSPYYVFNLYLGGVSFACRNTPLTAEYVHNLALQGWTFIPTWVGPQAPCSQFLRKMSSDAATAYSQGRDEADAAFATAENILGLLEDKIIYYDMEAYGFDPPPSCRDAVSAFMEGWVERLHERGVKAGGYGARYSFITDWAENAHPPDDIWIASWIYDEYTPDATAYEWLTWLPSSLWPQSTHRRLRQYAGGHAETWGGVAMTIDSNVLDGEVTSIPIAGADAPETLQTVEMQVYGPPMSSLGRSGPDSGWVISEGRLLVSQDGGETWKDVSLASTEYLAADFHNIQTGWAVVRRADRDELFLANTQDGGRTWQVSPLPGNDPAGAGAARASIHVEDGNRIQVALQHPSGSAFNIQEQLSTQDAGQTWQSQIAELAAGQPDAEYPEIFAGDEAQAAAPTSLPGLMAQAFFDDQHGWAILQRSQCRGPKASLSSSPSQALAPLICSQEWTLLATRDGGLTWREITPYDNLPAR